MKTLMFLAATLIILSCKSTNHQEASKAGCAESIKQGIKGQIFFKSGNMMPGPEEGTQTKGKGVAREVHIYELTNMNQVESEDNQFINKINTKPVKVVNSDDSGCFQVELAPGRYTVFVMEKGRLYANMSDGENNIFPVTVETGKVGDITFNITYDATF